LKPQFDTAVRSIQRRGPDWQVDADGLALRAPVVVVATGWADFPYRPSWPGQEQFQGTIIHSSAYRNPLPYARQRVLVVGFGNSGGEIALDLAESGVEVALAVRGPVQVLPRDLLGLPILTWAIAERHFPAWLTDRINAPAIRLSIGSLRKLGLRPSPLGPRQMVEKLGRVPILDVGTIAKIRAGAIRIRPGIERFTADGIVFTDRSTERFDAVVLATGFRPDVRHLLPGIDGLCDGTGRPLVNGAATREAGLFFCGFIASATGQLREIGIEAERIAGLAQGIARA
jgi:cation diffusion facilitator CzcD-associated flavoprotein CzcO